MSLTKHTKAKVKNSKNSFLTKKSDQQKIIAIAGNPNVGKSTVFNAITGLRQHTGNWPGKTVSCTYGTFKHDNSEFVLVDIPGTYSLLSHSQEEEIARDFICFENPDTVIITVDATCLERNLNLALQILELTNKAVICLNLIDEAKKKKINIDTDELSLQLGVPVIATNARSKKGIQNLIETAASVSLNQTKVFKIKTDYGETLESSVNKIEKSIKSTFNLKIDSRWLSLRLLENNRSFNKSFRNYLKKQNKPYNKEKVEKFFSILSKEKEKLKEENLTPKSISDKIVKSLIQRSEKIYNLCVKTENRNYDNSDRIIDKILTSKLTGFPIMILLLLGIFWITISGANYPSELISSGLFWLQDKIMELMINTGSPPWLYGILVSGIYRTLAWVVSVMLPPMAIFFPLFTILEDIGYLPRVAFNLDHIFKKSGAHGKQALTMCMGFGCNACGVIGCRIIDSPREKMIALLTNNFVPCNGRFPLLISIISMFFINQVFIFGASFLKAAILTGTIIIGILFTFFISKILSKTILKGLPSSFILELPPYRKPQIGKILIRSVFDRTIFVLGRAIAVAAPAGMIIWLMANIKLNNISVLMHCSSFLDPFAKLLGMDGMILLAFILGFPANEIVFPIIIMGYMCTESIIQLETPMQLYNLLTAHGWNYITAISIMLFSLMHFPCGTTCWTIKKETGNLKWTILAFIVPTVTGITMCFTVSNILKLISKV